MTNVDHGAVVMGPEIGECPICQTTPSKRLVWDHDHSTGQFRGYICSPCNAAIGMLKDDAEIVLRAFAYLTTHLR